MIFIVVVSIVSKRNADCQDYVPSCKHPFVAIEKGGLVWYALALFDGHSGVEVRLELYFLIER